MVRMHSSAAGVLALLSEPEPLLREHALKRAHLVDVVGKGPLSLLQLRLELNNTRC